jgi:hypothetical protein
LPSRSEPPGFQHRGNHHQLQRTTVSSAVHRVKAKQAQDDVGVGTLTAKFFMHPAQQRFNLLQLRRKACDAGINLGLQFFGVHSLPPLRNP